MPTRPFIPFGVSVRAKLLEIGQPQEWLIQQCHDKTGLYVDTGYLYKIFTGERSAPKIAEAIKEILDI